MPNYCANTMTITGPAEKLKALVAKANADNDCRLLNAMRPMPEEFYGKGCHLDSDWSDWKEGVRPIIDGCRDWWEWSIKCWGTKWDVCHIDSIPEPTDNGDGTATLSMGFDTAWAPPIAAIKHYLAANSDVDITLLYHESGMCFAGIYENGVDSCYGYGDWKEGDREWEHDHMKRLESEFGIRRDHYEEDEE